MFSVIIPLYNKAAYIEKAINSVLSQTYNEFELIVVDDGSKDNGFDIVNQMFDTLAPPLGGWKTYQEMNQGVSIARNNGVKLAQYDYIAFLDADDWWEPTYLEEMKGLIDEFSEAGIYGSSYFIVKNGYKKVATVGVESDFTKGMINYCRVYANTLCMPLWTGATVIKKSIFNLENGFKPNLKLGEDFDLWLRVSLHYQVAFLNKPLSNYNQDVELNNRAIGEKLYEPDQHMLFSNYELLKNHIEFQYLFEQLAVYGLLPYYLAGKNKREVNDILNKIHWENHAIKYRLQYKVLPKWLVKSWIWMLKVGVSIKKRISNSKIYKAI